MVTFVCPIDRGRLTSEAHSLTCDRCGTVFPVVRGIPILINDNNSVFQRADFLSSDAYQGASGYDGAADSSTGLRRAYRRFARRLSQASVPGDAAFHKICEALRADETKRVLVIGAGERPRGDDAVRTDVAFAAGIDCICDAHDLPFEDGAFDVVYAESVLEHVCDPQRCVGEITRVLAAGGTVVAMTPFLQPVHMGAYDFTRFTYLGHRRLFRMFDDAGSGMCGGPGYSAIHILRNLVTGITTNKRTRSVLRLIMLLITYPLRYTDPFFRRSDAAYDAACAFYFVGTKRECPIPDRDILLLFRGA
nr:methyltransferase domain-containing protein [uncultured Rhodopila sp.]